MTIDDIKEELKENWIELWGRIQDSPAYNNLREQYENLSPNAQRILIVGAAAFIVFIFAMIPYSYFSSSFSSDAHYVSNRNLIRKLLRANQLASESESMPKTVDADTLKTKITDMLAHYPLLPEQNGGIVTIPPDDLGPGVAVRRLRVSGVGVKLKKLNLKQIVEIGYELESQNPNVKLAGIDMTADRTNTHYFDVLFKLAVYNLPSAFEASSTKKSDSATEPPTTTE